MIKNNKRKFHLLLYLIKRPVQRIILQSRTKEIDDGKQSVVFTRLPYIVALYFFILLNKITRYTLMMYIGHYNFVCNGLL